MPEQEPPKEDSKKEAPKSSPLPSEVKISKLELTVGKFGGVPVKEKLFFVQNLGVMVRSGLSMSKSLRTLGLQTKNKYFSYVLTDIANEVEKGVAFSKALSRYPKIFPELFTNMIESGELSGNLENVLQSLYTQMKKDHDLVSKVRGAMIYPSVIVVAMFGIGAFMMTVVIPKIISIFEEIEAEIPLPTQILIWISDFMSSYALIIFPVFFGILIAIFQFGKTPRGKLVFHWLWLRLPVVKAISSKINIARFARTLSSLLKTEISIVEALHITSNTVGNVYYKKALSEIADRIKTGAQINEIMVEYPKLFPPIIIQMTIVGEESGSLDDILAEIAQFFEADIDQTMENLPSLIEPILILFLGVGVGYIAVSILLPMFNLTQSI